MAAIDVFLHDFVARLQILHRTIGVDGPALLQAEILTPVNLLAMWNYDRDHAIARVREEGFVFPAMQVDNWNERIEAAIRPIWDHAHQMFGLSGSQWFNAAGDWIDPRAG